MKWRKGMNDLLQAVGICLILLTMGSCLDFCSKTGEKPDRTFIQYLQGK